MLDIQAKQETHREGELYKTVEIYGRSFHLYYGYYEECDRENPLCRPIPIYPDFTKEPVLTPDGKPFATMMQDACDQYEGTATHTFDTTCADCKYFERGEEWFGICNCPRNRERKDE